MINQDVSAEKKRVWKVTEQESIEDVQIDVSIGGELNEPKPEPKQEKPSRLLSFKERLSQMREGLMQTETANVVPDEI